MTNTIFSATDFPVPKNAELIDCIRNNLFYMRAMMSLMTDGNGKLAHDHEAIVDVVEQCRLLINQNLTLIDHQVEKEDQRYFENNRHKFKKVKVDDSKDDAQVKQENERMYHQEMEEIKRATSRLLKNC